MDTFDSFEIHIGLDCQCEWKTNKRKVVCVRCVCLKVSVKLPSVHWSIKKKFTKSAWRNSKIQQNMTNTKQSLNNKYIFLQISTLKCFFFLFLARCVSFLWVSRIFFYFCSPASLSFGLHLQNKRFTSVLGVDTELNHFFAANDSKSTWKWTETTSVPTFLTNRTERQNTPAFHSNRQNTVKQKQEIYTPFLHFKWIW